MDDRDEGHPGAPAHEPAGRARAGSASRSNYQLSPRVRWPEHLIDAKRALAWVREHIAEYGGDPDRIVVTGGSAGGHLTAMLALTANDARYQPGFEHVDTSVSGAIPMYGAYDLAETFGRFDRGFGRRIAGRMGSSSWARRPTRTSRRYSTPPPSHHVDAKACPFLVVHGTIDNLVPVAQARRFVAALRDVGTDVTYVELAGAPHAFDVFHSTWEHASTTGIEWWLGSSPIPRRLHRSTPKRRLAPAPSVQAARRRLHRRGSRPSHRTIRGRRTRSDRSDDHGAYGAIVMPASASSTRRSSRASRRSRASSGHGRARTGTPAAPSRSYASSNSSRAMLIGSSGAGSESYGMSK